jgi:hypothetical protein
MMSNFKTPLLSIHRLGQKKSTKDISELKNIIYKMDLSYIYRVFHPTAADYTFFLATPEIFSKIDHILGHKASLNK